jgi:integrase
MGHVQDLWFSPGPGGDDAPTARNGKGKRWKARYIDTDDRERSKCFARKADAEKFLTQVEADVLRGTYLDPDAGKITLRRYVTSQWLPSRSYDARTREEVERRLNLHILPKLGDKRLDQLARSPSAISGWMAGLPVSARYIGQILTVLSSVLSSAVDDGLIARNPCKVASVRPPAVDKKKIVPWTSAQVSAARADMPERYRAMADCGSGLGLRQGEIIGLPLDAVDFLRRNVRVRLQVRHVYGKAVFALPKGRKVRDVPLPESVSLALAEHIRKWPPVKVTLPWLEPGGKPHTETLIFTGKMRGAIDNTYLNKAVWRPAVRAAGLPASREHGMHSLRHFYASTLLRGGVDIKRVSAYLGHTSAAFTLATYTHLLADDEDRSLRDIEAALAAAKKSNIALNATEA